MASPAVGMGEAARFSAAPSDFVLGLNTLTMQMTATDFEAEGARLEALLSGDVSGGPPGTLTVSRLLTCSNGHRSARRSY